MLLILAAEHAAAEQPATLVVAPGAPIALEAADGLTVEAAIGGGPLRGVPDGALAAPDAGDHWLTTVSRDARGVPSPPRWVLVRVDREAPALTLAITPTPFADDAGVAWVPPGARAEARADDALAGLAETVIEAGSAVKGTADVTSVALPMTGGAVTVRAHAVDRVGNRSATEQVEVSVDIWPPTGTIGVDGPSVDAERGLVLGPASRLVLTSDDRGAGLATAIHRLGDAAVDDAAWSGGWPAGEHAASALLPDAVGNETVVDPLHFTLDDRGPAIEWRVDGEGIENGGTTFYRPPVRVTAAASDDAAGVASLAAAGQPAAGPWTVTGETVSLRAVDRVGNATEVEARWRIDDAPPEIVLRAEDGDALAPGEAPHALARGTTLRIEVTDDGSGVARAAHIWNRLTVAGRNPPAPVPEALVLDRRGHYRLIVEAVDRLGHASLARWRIDVEEGTR